MIVSLIVSLKLSLSYLLFMWSQIPLCSILSHVNKRFPAPSLQTRCSDSVSAAALELWSWRRTSAYVKTTTILQKCDHICWWYSTVFFCISLVLFSSHTLQRHTLLSCPGVVKERLTFASENFDAPKWGIFCIFCSLSCVFSLHWQENRVISVSISDAGMSSAVSSVIYKRLAP